MENLLEANVLGKGLNLVHLNVRSLMGGHRFDMIRHQIESSRVDIFTISESWLTTAIPDRVIECMNYNVVRLDRKWNDEGRDNLFPKRGGGVACYIKSDIKYSETKFELLNKSCRDLEMLWVSIEIDNMRPLVVITVYRPPQGDYKKCNTLLNEALERANLKDNTDIFVLGDFNIDLADKNSIKARELEFTARSLGLKQLVKSHTRIAHRNGQVSKSKLDLIFSNSNFITETRTLDLNISDHLAVLVNRKKVGAKLEKVEFAGRSYKNYRKEEFQHNLINCDWDGFYAQNDPNRLWDIMEHIILDQANQFCPLKMFKVKALREPWITNEAVEAIRDKDRLLKKARKSGKEADWANARLARNRVGRDLENLRADFLKGQQEINKNDPKNFWKSISSVFPGKKSKTSKIWLKHHTNDTQIEDIQAANYINTFFTNIGQNLARQFQNDWKYFGVRSLNTIDRFTTDAEEVKRLCREINPMKSSGMDELSSKLCKDAFLVLSEQLAHIFNSSLVTGCFPDKWKIAKILPLFKGGDRESVNNYRPVSLLPLPGKLLEKIVHKRISSFWEDNNILSANQGGFRKGYSTVATIADLTDRLFHHINLGDTTLAAFVDLRKAFDTVNLNILLKKLQLAGIGDEVLAWCKDYLTNRFQCTLANNVRSSLLPITCGVPQGSVLGPLFFLIYVNDVQQAVPNCGIKLYADDTVLFQSGVNKEEARTKLQRSVNEFKQWCDVNELTINVSKTKVMAFATRSKTKKCKDVNIVVGSDKLKVVPSYKYLGMTLDSTLNYSNHISSVIRMVSHKMTLLAKLRKYLTNEVAVLIYKTMLLPYFDYADVIFHKANVKDTGKLQTLQNKCLRICLRKERRFSTDGAHKEANVPFLTDRRTAHVNNFMFIRKRNKSLINNKEIRTRAHDAPLFNVEMPRCETFKRSVGYFGSSQWNNLPVVMRNTETYLGFKHKQKVIMLHPLSRIQLPDVQ